MSRLGARLLFVSVASSVLLAEYLCFSNVPLVPAPGGGPPFGLSASYLPVSPQVGHALVIGQPLLTFPLGTVVASTFRNSAYSSVSSLHGWPRLVFLCATPFGFASGQAVRGNLVWLSVLNFLSQVLLLALAARLVSVVRRREAAA